MELRVENLCYDYNKGTSFEKRALNNINLSIKENEFIGLIGHTGSGKSTLIQTFNGLLAPTEGKVTWNGKDIYEKGFNRREFRSHVGIVFQYPEYQLFETTVLKDVCFGPKNLGISEEESKRKAKEALRLVGLDEKYWQHSPFELSGGQKRRAAIAGVLAMEPEILILDEPTAGLDPKGRDEILGVIKKLNEREKPMVFLLWGANARSKKQFITNPNHLVLEAAHPSPLSAYNGFFGCRHFSKCNAFLEAHGIEPVDWRIE